MDWHKVPIKLLDIRLVKLSQGAVPPPYTLPANAFLLAVQGSAGLALDGVRSAHAQGQLLHAGKGASLEISGIATSPFGYYLVLYKPMASGGEGGTLGKLIFKDYGFQMPEGLKQFKDGGTALSVEAFVAQPADYFFTQMTDEEMASLTEKFKEPLYQSIPAVKNNRVINVSRDKWNYGPYLVDEAVDEFIEKMKQLQ
ncbi:hypothetical protein [Cohnella sp. GCM10027633]|uniref:hypothetical protein n=1 Tax=unclassified Cohnella TaxID=2636738 RepID=UPI003628F806